MISEISFELHNELIILIRWINKLGHRTIIIPRGYIPENIQRMTYLAYNTHSSIGKSLVTSEEDLWVDDSVLKEWMFCHFLHSVGPSFFSPSINAVDRTRTTSRRNSVQSKWLHIHYEFIHIRVLHVKIPSQNVEISCSGVHPF